MHFPYTPQPLDALMIAQTSVGLALTAVTWSRPSRPTLSSFLLLAAVWWTVMLPVEQELFGSFGVALAPDHYHWSLRAVATLASVSALLSGRPITAVVAIAAQIALSKLIDYVPESEWELAAFHLAYLGALVGVQARARDGDVRPLVAAPATLDTTVAGDLRIFSLATLLGIAVSIFVLEQSIDSSDEWAYTFQAAVFAKGRFYAPSPPCTPAFQNFWVFDWMGRQFSQYTPGWPLFMAPFMLLRVPQFAAAASFGLLAVGVARLARRAARESGYSERTAVAAGNCAALCTMLSSTLLVNAGSRFGHVFVAALLAWGIEAVCAVTDARSSSAPRAGMAWSIVLGTCVAMLPATRPGDGTMCAAGLFVFGLWALCRGRFSLRSIAGAGAVAAFLGGLTLVALRVQIGRWFKTGYSLTPTIYPWGQVKFSWPQPANWKWGVPLASGAYCWWPLSPALGVAGLLMLRGRARRLAFMLGFGAIALFGFASFLELGRGYDWGYGPRYVLPAVVPMAVGTGVALAPLWLRSTRSVRMAGGPWTLACLAILLGVVRLIPLVYPMNTASVRTLNALNQEIRREKIHRAVVLVPSGVGWMNDGLDLTMNLPLSLYPNQDVIVAMDKNPVLTQCVRDHFPDRAFYKALPGATVQLKKD